MKNPPQICANERCLFLNKNSILDLSLNKKVIKNTHSQIFSIHKFRVAGARGFLCARQANIVLLPPGESFVIVKKSL